MLKVVKKRLVVVLVVEITRQEPHKTDIGAIKPGPGFHGGMGSGFPYFGGPAKIEEAAQWKKPKTPPHHPIPPTPTSPLSANHPCPSRVSESPPLTAGLNLYSLRRPWAGADQQVVFLVLPDTDILTVLVRHRPLPDDLPSIDIQVKPRQRLTGRKKAQRRSRESATAQTH